MEESTLTTLTNTFNRSELTSGSDYATTICRDNKEKAEECTQKRTMRNMKIFMGLCPSSSRHMRKRGKTFANGETVALAETTPFSRIICYNFGNMNQYIDKSK
ncbi:hypothetical protein SESBI_24011 [Sesbania bispinosa]|nr:hypothetical protein SESBI_24011 [Sesbania bispinosa]